MSAIFSLLELCRPLNENLSQNINNISGLQEIWWHDFVNNIYLQQDE